jgi:hypothetical protein
MARKPETTFIASVNKHLQCTYSEKMHNPYRSGTPDVWYSGDKNDLWAEYKFLQSIPVKVDIRLDLSALQTLWLRRRYHEGRNVAVICGCKEGGVVFTDLSWEQPLAPSAFRSMLVDRKQIAMWIHNQTTGKPYDTNKTLVRGGQAS